MPDVSHNQEKIVDDKRHSPPWRYEDRCKRRSVDLPPSESPRHVEARHENKHIDHRESPRHREKRHAHHYERDRSRVTAKYISLCKVIARQPEGH